MSMKKRKSPPADEEFSLPEDLLPDILLSLPAKRVFEFRCLSKFYRDFINSAKFFEKYYDRSIKTSPSVLLGEMIIGSSSPRIDYLVDVDSARSNVTFCSLNKNPIMESYDLTKKPVISLVGCCRGILCYTIQEYDVQRSEMCIRLSFWNPYTGACRKSLAKHYPNCIPRGKFRCLLGYDSITDDLKLVHIMHDGEKFVSVVYSSKTDSWRRNIRGKDLNDYKLNMFLQNYPASAFVEGTNCVHILVSEVSSSSAYRKLLAFDFAEERFNLVSIPQQLREISDTKLLLLSGCLGLYCKPSPDRLDVWKMKEYGVEKSWVRAYCLKLGDMHSNPIPLALVNNGRQLLVVSPNRGILRLYLCDVEEEEEQELKEALLFVIIPKARYYVHPFPITPCLREP